MIRRYNMKQRKRHEVQEDYCKDCGFLGCCNVLLPDVENDPDYSCLDYIKALPREKEVKEAKRCKKCGAYLQGRKCPGSPHMSIREENKIGKAVWSKILYGK
jgi:hypothetical protein